VEEAVRAKMHRLIKEFNASSERGVKAGEMFCGAFESAPMTVIALLPPVPFYLLGKLKSSTSVLTRSF